jgi:hypothetical protein
MDENSKEKEKDEGEKSSERIKSLEKNQVDDLKDVKDKYLKKFEDEKLEEEIDSEVTKAEKLMREYESEIKKGNFEEESPYEIVLEIYKKIKKKLSDRGWEKQAAVYINQINLIKKKIDQDKKLREIEAKKREKDKVYQDSLKIQKKEEIDLKKFKSVEEKYKKDFEDEKFEREINEEVTKAENMIHKYDLKIKKGNFDAESPYEEVIDIYSNIRKKLIVKGWERQAAIYLNQINLIKNKIEQDKKLREIEARKKQKDKAYQDSLKIQKKEEIDLQKIKSVEEKYKKDFDDEVFQKQIDRQVNEAENMIRNYDLEIKKGNFDVEVPYQKVISIYNNIKENLLEREWKDQATIFQKQIELIERKIEQDKKLREIEA